MNYPSPLWRLPKIHRGACQCITATVSTSAVVYKFPEGRAGRTKVARKPPRYVCSCELMEFMCQFVDFLYPGALILALPHSCVFIQLREKRLFKSVFIFTSHLSYVLNLVCFFSRMSVILFRFRNRFHTERVSLWVIK